MGYLLSLLLSYVTTWRDFVEDASYTVSFHPLCPIHAADANATQLSSWVASAVWTEFATSSRRLPTGAFIPPTRRNLLLANSFRLVETVANYSCEFRKHRRRDSTRQLRRVGVGGVYWALLVSCREKIRRRIRGADVGLVNGWHGVQRPDFVTPDWGVGRIPCYISHE